MSKPRDDLPAAYVCTALRYEPSTGILTWKTRDDKGPQWNGKFAGKVAGTVNDRGYVIVTINGKDYRAHRLAWVIVTGAWPDGEIDHRNLVKSDNWWINLRRSTHAQNNQNKPAQSNNTSGYKGVSWCKLTKSWVARIKAGGRYIVVGRSESPEGAHVLYAAAAGQHHGEFSNVASRR